MKKGMDYTGVTVVFFCHDGNGNVVLSLRNELCRDEYGTWDPGGGGVEFAEHVEDTIRREVMEEYCTEPMEIEFLGVRDVHRVHEGQPTHWIALDHRVLVDPASVKNGEPHKHDDVSWFTKETLPENLHSQFPYFLEKYHGRLW